jgi:hypothetical protein
MEQILAGLGNRVFLLNNVHDDAPETFETRWTLSYLRGPLTRAQIKILMDGRKALGVKREAKGKEQNDAKDNSSPLTPHASHPVLPPNIPQYFVPARGPQAGPATYRPMLLGAAQVRVADAKAGVDVTQDVTVVTPITDGAVAVDWDAARAAGVAVADLEKTPQDRARFAALPGAAGKAGNFDAWRKDFANWLCRSHTVEVFRSPSLKETSRPGETERDFRVRLRQAAHERRDQVAQKLRDKYAPKIAALQERKRRAGQAVEREAEQAAHSRIQTAIAIGATLLEAFTGRKAIKTSTIGKATTAARSAGRAMKDGKNVVRAEDNVAALDRQIAGLETQFKAEAESLAAAADPLTEQLDVIPLKPARANVSVRLVALAWMPDG